MKKCFAILLTLSLLLTLAGFPVEAGAHGHTSGVVTDEAIKVQIINGKIGIGSSSVTATKPTEETTAPTEKIQVCKVCCNTLTECETCDGTGDCDDCLESGKHKDPSVDLCSGCDGTGYEHGKSTCISCRGRGSCSLCKGKGEKSCRICSGSGKCGFCKGSGKWGISNTKCKTCNGKGAEKLIDCPNDGDCADCEGKGMICQKCLDEKKAEEEKKTRKKSSIISPHEFINKKETTPSTPSRSCGRCGGSGGISCYNCNGSSCVTCGGDGRFFRFRNGRMEMELCGMCFGKACVACGGSGYRDCPDC